MIGIDGHLHAAQDTKTWLGLETMAPLVWVDLDDSRYAIAELYGGDVAASLRDLAKQRRAQLPARAVTLIAEAHMAFVPVDEIADFDVATMGADPRHMHCIDVVRVAVDSVEAVSVPIHVDDDGQVTFGDRIVGLGATRGEIVDALAEMVR